MKSDADALRRVWAKICEAHPELPDATLVLAIKHAGEPAIGQWASAGEGAAFGEVRLARWCLALGADEALAALLHAAAHALAFVRGVSDTSRQGRYHNGGFRAVAEEVGLLCEKRSPHGWAVTRLADATRERYAVELEDLGQLCAAVAAAAPLLESSDARSSAARSGGKRIKLTCACEPWPRAIWCSASTAEEGEITCGVCHRNFLEEGTL